MRFYIYIILFLFASCSEKDNFYKKKGEVSSNEKAEKKSIYEGKIKFDGPDKSMYQFELKKHGGPFLTEPSRYEQYPPDNNEKVLREMKKRNRIRLSQIQRNSKETFTNYAKENANFISRGPFNTPGRVMSLVVDKSDPSNKMMASVGGAESEIV